MVPLSIGLVMVIVEGNLLLFGQGPGKDGHRTCRIRPLLGRGEIPDVFFSVFKGMALQFFQPFRQLANLLVRKVGKIKKVDEHCQIFPGQFMVPVPVQGKGALLPIHHPAYFPAHDRETRFLQAGQISSHRFPAHRHAVLFFHIVQYFLLGQGMLPVRFPDQDLHNPHDGHLASCFTVFSGQSTHHPLVSPKMSRIQCESFFGKAHSFGKLCQNRFCFILT